MRALLDLVLHVVRQWRCVQIKLLTDSFGTEESPHKLEAGVCPNQNFISMAESYF